MTKQEIIKAFKETKRTSNKTIKEFKEIYDAVANKTVYIVNMTDGTKYLYSYEQTAQHNYGHEPKFYNRIIKIK